MIVNESPFAASTFVALEPDGGEVWVAVVRASFGWGPDGRLAGQEAQAPVREEDAWSGAPGESGLVAASDLAPPKPRVDVLLEGQIRLPAPAARADVALQIGARRKAAAVFGDRFWLPGVLRALALSEPRPFQEMPFSWERAFGGADPEHPACVERRNPAGRGMRKKADRLLKQPAPNFEDPRKLVSSWDDRPSPVGFGPVAAHWEPRVRLAGTYDVRWREDRFPLLPADFDPRFHNCAPADQQLDAYEPGLEVRLERMTPAGVDAFRLPRLEIPVTFVRARGPAVTAVARPDTVIVEPAAGRVSIVARAACPAEPDVYAVRQVIVAAPPSPAVGARTAAARAGAGGVS